MARGRLSAAADDFIAGLFVPIARATGRSYSKFSRAAERSTERTRQQILCSWRRGPAHARTHVRPGEKAGMHALLSPPIEILRSRRESFPQRSRPVNVS